MAGRLAVIGAGLMGSGIAQVAAQAGWQVTLRDVDEAANRGLAASEVAGAVRRARARSRRRASRRPWPDHHDHRPGRGGRRRHRGRGGVREARGQARGVPRAGQDLRADAVLATNTSAIPITQIAAVTERPEAVVGTHFFSPVPMMKLCELVRGYKTSDETLATARAFAEEIGKTCIVVNRDIAGFVTTRLISALVVEAVKLVESGVVTAEDLDIACKLGFGHAMGPLATTDLTGVDVLLHATRNIYTDTADEKFFPPELLQRMVTAGDLGRKTGKGFYTLLRPAAAGAVRGPPRSARSGGAASAAATKSRAAGMTEPQYRKSCPPSAYSARAAGSGRARSSACTSARKSSWRPHQRPSGVPRSRSTPAKTASPGTTAGEKAATDRSSPGQVAASNSEPKPPMDHPHAASRVASKPCSAHQAGNSSRTIRCGSSRPAGRQERRSPVAPASTNGGAPRRTASVRKRPRPSPEKSRAVVDAPCSTRQTGNP